MDHIETVHPVGMLDRDLRTAKMPQEPDDYCDYIHQPSYHVVHVDKHLCARDTSTRRCNRRYQSSHHPQMLLLSRILQLLFVGIILSLLSPNTYARPIGKKCQVVSSELGDWWINPNNYTPNATETPTVDDGTPIDKLKSINPLFRQTTGELKKAKEIMKNNTDLKSIIERYKSQTFTWIDGGINDTFDDNLELTKFLLKSYEDFQKIAVAIDHGIAHSRVHNQVKVGGEEWEFVLNSVRDHLRLVLTEIQTALIEMNVTIEKNVGRDIIPDNVKFICENTDVGIFNAIAYKHYFNYLNDFKEMLGKIVGRL